MHEKSKIAEANYFLGHLTNDLEPVAFRYELSAFLNASRSALQYALEEAKVKRHQKWYEDSVKGDAIVGFLSEKRNINIHHQPIVPSNSVAVHGQPGFILLRSRLSVAYESCNGTPEPKPTELSSDGGFSSCEAIEPIISTNAKTRVVYGYTFVDWPGPESVADLCRSLLTKIEAIVADGVNKGILTP